MAKIATTVSGFKAADSALLEAPKILNRETRKALRSAGRIVVQAAEVLVPPPGYPGDDPNETPLADLLAVEVKQGTRALFAVVGAKRPEGAHAHLVEESHRHYSHGAPTGVMTQEHPFLRPAAEHTEREQRRAIARVLEKVDQAIGRRLR